MVIRLCERFHCLPSQLYAEDGDLLRMVRVYDLGQPDRSRGEAEPDAE